MVILIVVMIGYASPLEVGGRKEVSHPLSPTHRHITPAVDNQWASSTQPQQNITFSIKAKFGLISIARIVFSISNMVSFIYTEISS